MTSSRANALATGVNGYVGNSLATPSSAPATKLTARTPPSSLPSHPQKSSLSSDPPSTPPSVRPSQLK
ncbi:uncharacterized protein K444DRAFT_615629 [Hyaloscypha bicolor E]|uniref:Uncharacterized protein n=1 Tax=Hyaloscypha bicolor E TaxID=1095630 RepID=A0A2J6T2A8_9HELO|nr:uncharacterized protein K444DRAFT_615629 [Hyaloscypha bicolor E]PMD57151.1 hypothetical protein K444DRAFT_615629 [Hyaloscypha bicolor E]